MEFLNLKTTKVFTKLIHTLRGGQDHKIINEPFMPLSIDKIGHGIATPWGKADVYTMCHYYIQNGDFMYDPEMRFFMVDNRDGNPAELKKVCIAPYLFRQTNLGIYEESVILQGCTLSKFHRPMQAAHTEFANVWLTNLEEQGFINF